MPTYEVTFVDEMYPRMTPVVPRFTPVDRQQFPGAYALPIPTSGHRMSPMRSPTVQMIAGLAGPEDDAEREMDLMKRAMKEAALKNAAIQVGIGVTLACIPVVGWIGLAIQAAYAAATMTYGHKIKAKIKREMEGYTERIKAHIAQNEARVKAAESQAYDEEYDGGKELADSGQPLDDGSIMGVDAATGTVKLAASDGMLIDPNEAPIEMVPENAVDGLGNVWLAGPVEIRYVDCGPAEGLGGNLFQNVERAVSRAIVKPVVKTARKMDRTLMKVPLVKKIGQVAGRVVAEVHIRPVWIAGKSVFRIAGFVAKATGNKQQAQKWRDREKQWDRRSKYQMQKMAQSLSNPADFAKSMREAWRLTTGEQSLRTTREKLNQMEATARNRIDAETSAQLAKIATPEYRAELRLQIARAIRDPANATDDNLLRQVERSQAEKIEHVAAGFIDQKELAGAAKSGGMFQMLAPAAGLVTLLAFQT